MSNEPFAVRSGRQYRYVVTDVWGCMEDRLSVGEALIENKYKGLHGEWTIYNMQTREPIGGMKGHYIGRREEQVMA